MKKKITKEATFCDNCGKETYVAVCLRCGAEHCYDCQKKIGVEYTHAVNFSGSGDGYYCVACDSFLRKRGGDSLHTAYLGIKRLKNEARGFYDDFKERSDKAEEKAAKLLKKH